MVDGLERQIEELGILPVIKINDPKDAEPLAAALSEGGLPCAEITFRTDAAAEAIRIIRKTFPDMLVGAGTVLSEESADAAIDAGAQFIVTPGMNPNTIRYCLKKGIRIIPGCATAGDIETAMSFGLTTVKFFPAEVNGGLKAIKALSAPYSNIKFMPTGGISAQNVTDYLRYDKVLACGGTWMVPEKEIALHNFDKIKALTADAVKTMHGFRLSHVALRCSGAEQAELTAKKFTELFGFEAGDANGLSFLPGNAEPGNGIRGHIAVQANSVERAIAYLEKKGIMFNPDSYMFNANGRLQSAFSKEPLGDFMLMIVRNTEGG